MTRHQLIVPTIASLVGLLLTAAVTPAAARTIDGSDGPPLAPAIVSAGPATGRVLIELPTGGAPVAARSGYVQLYDAEEYSTTPIATAVLTSSGNFTLTGFESGQYLVEFVSTDTRALPVREWFSNASARFSASSVTILDDTEFDFGDVVLESREIDTERLSGADRFATAAAISARYASAGAARDIIIVNGLDFPDALSAGPFATREGAVVLMVTRTGIPAATAAELNRLSPQSITIIGGTGVVSSSVANQLDDYIDGPGTVTRIAGADRYETSRRVIAAGFDALAPSRLFVATGRGFADALAAVPAAGTVGGAVLLVDGSRSRLDAATRAFIDDLGVPVTIIGGTGSVSAGVFDDIDDLGLDVVRVSGSNRYATSVAIAITYFPLADSAYLANGRGFADALAVGSFAGTYGAPLYLTEQDCVPGPVVDDIITGLMNHVIGIGGGGSVSNAALQLTACP